MKGPKNYGNCLRFLYLLPYHSASTMQNTTLLIIYIEHCTVEILIARSLKLISSNELKLQCSSHGKIELQRVNISQPRVSIGSQ